MVEVMKAASAMKTEARMAKKAVDNVVGSIFEDERRWRLEEDEGSTMRGVSPRLEMKKKESLKDTVNWMNK